MTSQIRSHRICNAILYYSCVYFIFKLDEKSSLCDGLQKDLMMILGSGLLLGPPCIFSA